MESHNESLNRIKFEQFGTSYPKLQIIPTIDISKGRAVLVNKGNVLTDNGDPFERAKELSINSDFQVADIDAAKGTGSNSEIIKQISNKYSCYVAGGIRSLDKANYFLSENAKRIVIGTSVFNTDLLEKIPSNRLILAFDIDDKFNLLFKGRTEPTTKNLFDVLEQNKKYLSAVTITFHNIEGTGKGIDIEKVKKIKQYLIDQKLESRLVVAGGISSVQEVKDLLDMDVCPQFGYALWKKLFTLGDIYSSIMNYDKLKKFQTDTQPTLVPCIIIRNDGMPLSLTYTDKDGIKETVDSKELVIYSRSKNKRWKKGTESGNVQHLIQVSFNCDRTSLLYVVEGNNFCSKDKVSCFNYRNPSRGGMEFLEEIIKATFAENKEDAENFKKKILENKKWLICRILEEVNELSGSNNDKHEEILISTISDLIYYLTLYCVSSNIPVIDIYNELARRHFTLSKPKYEITPLPEGLKLGICLNKDQEKIGYDYLKRNGLMIEQDITKGKRSMKYKAYFMKDPEFKIIPFIIKPKDVYRFFDYGYMDAVICFEDVLDNYSLVKNKVILPNEKAKEDFPFIYSRIIVISDKSFNLEEVKQSRKQITIYTEYLTLAKKWIEQEKLNAELIFVSGEAEGFLVNGLCDLCVSIADKEGIEKNNLKESKEIKKSELCIFSKNEFYQKFNEMIFINE